MSAATPITRGQLYTVAILFLFILACAFLWPLRTGQTLILFCTLYYLAATLYKLVLMRASSRAGATLRFTPEEVAVEREWPVYSILVPMYKEPETLPQMVAGLAALDYPDDRKDVQLLLEEDDRATCDAAAAMDLPPFIRVTVVPPSFPRTKPKACNVGLGLARGEFLVIYDAEDKPEPDQLKKAVLAFGQCDSSVACVQSRLNFYNPTRNLLTRWFTADYSAWFDLQLPGLAALKTVIPLGGTSNHFRLKILRDLLGWDAYNVTEDCDLGVRLARQGYTTRMLDTTTWEEACASLPFWIKQRTRWQKGYIQTWFVHMRNPFALLRDLGPLHFLHYQLLIGGGFFSALINPVFWILAIVWFFIQPSGISALFPGGVFAAGVFCLFVGNFCFVYVNLIACFQRGYDRLLFANLFTPFYWALMSVSGWRALWQFFRNPFYWEKTQHGIK